MDINEEMVLKNAQATINEVKEMLKREPIDCNPKIILNEDKTNFYGFSQDDIYLEDYPKKLIRKKNPQLKFDLGI